MKYMLMMNAKREKGGGDWQVMNWAPEDLKAHIGFMVNFGGELKQSGNLVGVGTVAPLDALQVINYLDTQGAQTAAWSPAVSPNWLATDLNHGPAMVVPESSALVLASPAACLLLWLLVKRVRSRGCA